MKYLSVCSKFLIINVLFAGLCTAPSNSGTPKGWKHYLTFQNLICCLYNKRRYVFDWDYSCDWACSTHTRKASAVGQETRREYFKDGNRYGGLTLKVSHKNVCLDWMHLAQVVFKAG